MVRVLALNPARSLLRIANACGIVSALLVGCTRADAVTRSEKPRVLVDGATHASAVDASSSRLSSTPHAVDSSRDGGSGDARDPHPFGTSVVAEDVLCHGEVSARIANRDLRTSYVSGDDLLAIVNRAPTGVLGSGFVPSDLVDLRSGKPASASECVTAHCLRKEAADALSELLAEMKRRGFAGKVESAFRSYATQCWTFLHWAKKGSFCGATEQSALPGHSQHQLGTTIDLFTEEWAGEGAVFRAGFGCTAAGKFLQSEATAFGFVLPYPLHPDDRHPKQSCVARSDIPVSINPKTGYRYEHWHIRYIGKDAAKRFADAVVKSGPGTPTEITLEQWLRDEKKIGGGDAELPVCDGCNCGACSTLAPPGESVCDKKGGALHLDGDGLPLPATGTPRLVSARFVDAKKWRGRVLEIDVDVPPGVATQPPIAGVDAAGYDADATYGKLAPYPKTAPRAYPPLPSAWVIGVEPVAHVAGTPFPWRSGLASSAVGATYNRANVLLPAFTGSRTTRIPLPESANHVKVVLLEGGAIRSEPIVVDAR